MVQALENTAKTSPADSLSERVFANHVLNAMSPVPLLTELGGELVAMPDLVELLARAIADEPPLALKEGGLIRDGFDPALDDYGLPPVRQGLDRETQKDRFEPHLSDAMPV